MLKDIFLAIIQASTEFLPISSSGHLALFSNFLSQPNLYFFTVLHLSSLLAILIFTRREIATLLTFDKKYRKMWLYVIIGSIPAALFGFLYEDVIERTLSSFLYLGIAFIFTGVVLFLTKFAKARSELNGKNAFLVGLFQVLALFPGVSRSGITISSALFLGIDKEKAVKFSFLLFIPLSLGAFILELKKFYFNASLLISFIVCFILSLVFVNIIFIIVKNGKLWWFSIYCFVIGSISLLLHFTD